MELIIILIIFVTAFVIAVNTRKKHSKYGKQCITQQHPIRRWTV